MLTRQCQRASADSANHVIIPCTNLGSEAALILYVPAQIVVTTDGEGTGELDIFQTAALYDCGELPSTQLIAVVSP
jgi:hypothetical protein